MRKGKAAKAKNQINGQLVTAMTREQAKANTPNILAEEGALPKVPSSKDPSPKGHCPLCESLREALKYRFKKAREDFEKLIMEQYFEEEFVKRQRFASG